MNVDAKFQTEANFWALKKLDPNVAKVVANFSFVSLYKFDHSSSNWKKINFEGPMFMVQRTAAAKFGMIVANRVSLENFTFVVDDSFYAELKKEFIIFKSNIQKDNNDRHEVPPIIYGLWISDDKERHHLYHVLLKCVEYCTKILLMHKNSSQIQEEENMIPIKNEHTIVTNESMNRQRESQRLSSNGEDLSEQQHLKNRSPDLVTCPEGLLTPAMILGEKNVPNLNSRRNENSDLFKIALKEVLLQDDILTLFHTKYETAAARR